VVVHCTENEAMTLGIGNRLDELISWLSTLEPSFAFLLSLPFLVAGAGFLAEYCRVLRHRINQ
jgi:hypothetical protein